MSKVEMVYLYYDNPQMLRLQIDYWNSYIGVLSRPPGVILIDDGSPHTQAVDIVKAIPCKIPIRVFRITQDIPWNFTGARNLGCFHARYWIYMSDIDTILTEGDAKKLFEEIPLDKNCHYKPKTVWFPDQPFGYPGNVNFLYHKKAYLNIGGYDEDYAGNYGRGDTDFMNQLEKISRKVVRDDVLVRVVSPITVSDACTMGKERDKAKNIELYRKKEAAGFPKPVNPLRFSWKRVF